MNKLKLYLAHTWKTRFVVKKLQERLEKNFNLEIINPFYTYKKKDIEKKYAKLDRYGMKFPDCKIIVDTDLELIRDSNAVLVILFDISIGSVMELFYTAYVLHKRIFLISPKRKILNHPWVTYCVKNYKFKNLIEFEDWLRRNGYGRK